MHHSCGDMMLLPCWQHQGSTDLRCKGMCGNGRAFSRAQWNSQSPVMWYSLAAFLSLRGMACSLTGGPSVYAAICLLGPGPKV